ncbi:DUF1810 domain-containing protein [Alicycliphilus denitrificans]|uniref:DUF1810 family protein n=1 Tax=Alicycliphilus denitrificans TaxID=179636 RepID=A0A3R7ECV3_9BURK|nr:DUF1810 domain-containing protein [Alicycliphilus denitrificans]RKJ95440.1 DUF1810 family protein [Alicycliphilus denitrificans]
MTNHLDRFVKAQDGIFDNAIEEILAGKKQTHWMWFIFPQLRGLGQSENAHFYGIRTLNEARNYLAHPILGPRLKQATQSVIEANVSPQEIFGGIDCQKFASCMTLFGEASPPESVFNQVLRTISITDERTITMLRREE